MSDSFNCHYSQFIYRISNQLKAENIVIEYSKPAVDWDIYIYN